YCDPSDFLRCQGQQCFASTRQEGILVFVWFDIQRCTETDRAQQWQRQDSALGHHPVQVGNPDGDQLHIGARQAQPIKAALEGQKSVFQITRALGKHDQRVAGVQRVEDGLQWVAGRVASLAVNQNSLKDLIDDVTAYWALLPIIRAGNGS